MGYLVRFTVQQNWDTTANRNQKSNFELGEVKRGFKMLSEIYEHMNVHVKLWHFTRFWKKTE